LISFANVSGKLMVAESGIHSRAQAAEAELAGARAVLVGTSLMQASDPEAKLRDLLARPLVKVCGLTRQEDVDAAVEAGADMLGFVFAEGSPRRAPAVLDVPDTALSVAVFVGEPEDRGANLVQVYKAEPGTVRGTHAWLSSLGSALGEGNAAYVADRPWEGDELRAHWRQAAESTMPFLMLAGGLGPENVREAIETVRPWAVDASSSLETAPGVKDHARVRAFVEAARG
jgi:phosphoribosylanthranilate isomerase